MSPSVSLSRSVAEFGGSAIVLANHSVAIGTLLYEISPRIGHIDLLGPAS
jgi:hypothetical protein